MEPKHVLFFAICIMNPMFQNVGMGLQKWAVDEVPKQETRAKKWTNWYDTCLRLSVKHSAGRAGSGG